VRRHAADVGRRLIQCGWLWTDIANLIHVAGRTLRHWCHELLDFFKPARLLGRPRVRSSRDVRNEVIHFLDEFGPGVGVPTLRDCFPEMCRAELDDLLKRYRRVWRERHRVPLRVLHWPIPDRVWAIDFAEPPTPIDGQFAYLLAVRDLATGMQLLWQPVAAATGAVAQQALASLFAIHGAPLVVKSDNGSHFTADAVQELLDAHQVECLFSPPHWPRYNGSIEAGIGSLKQRTEAHAARTGHPGAWTWDDTAGAFLEANTLEREHRPSPEDEWRQRTFITPDEREAFTACVEAQRRNEIRAQGACENEMSSVWSQREMARKAIRRALEECGYLHYQRRRILPPIPKPKAARIT
jgi:transposase InsO family protein